MTWHYESNGQPQGPVSETELCHLFATNQITAETRVWRKGMLEWQSLEDAAPEVIAQTIPPFEIHISQADRELLLKLSQAEFSKSAATVVETIPTPAWENPYIPLFSRFIRTFSEVLTTPEAALRSVSDAPTLAAPLAFLTLCSVISTISFLYIITEFQFLFPTTSETSTADDFPTLLASLFPLLVLLSSFMAYAFAFLLHKSTQVISNSAKPFAVTFRVVCYAAGTSQLLIIIPLLAISFVAMSGDLLATQNTFAISILSCITWTSSLFLRCNKSAHQLSAWQAISTMTLAASPLISLLIFIYKITPQAR